MPRKQAPKHLSKESQVWWREVTGGYELDSHHLYLLQCACECLDRAREARERVEVDGAYVPGKDGQIQAHPAIKVQRDSILAFTKCLRELDLDVEAPPDASRPPMLQRFRDAS